MVIKYKVDMFKNILLIHYIILLFKISLSNFKDFLMIQMEHLIKVVLMLLSIMFLVVE